MDVRGTLVRVIKIGGEDYVCLADMAKLKSEDAQQTISNWMRNRMTLEYLDLWEELYNPDFKPLGFEGFRKDVGLNHFTMSPNKWIEGVNAIGIVAQVCRLSPVPWTMTNYSSGFADMPCRRKLEGKQYSNRSR